MWFFRLLNYLRTRRIRKRALALMQVGFDSVTSFQIAEIVEWLQNDSAILASSIATGELSTVQMAINVCALRADEIKEITQKAQQQYPPEAE
jgi:hypothetical protein